MFSRFGVIVQVLAPALVLLTCASCPRRVEPVRVIYDQGAYGDTGGFSEIGNCDYVPEGQQLGDDFTLTGDRSTLTHIRWWGAYRDNVPAPDSFELLVCVDDGTGLPDMAGLYEARAETLTRVDTGTHLNPGGWNLDIYEYTFELPEEWEFEAGERYFLLLCNDTRKWLWSNNGAAAQGNNYGVSRARGTDWGAHAVDMAFQLWGH